MHFVMTAINNQTIKLADKGSRQTREVRRLACMGCGFEKGIWQKGCCDRCGGEKWRPLWAGAAASLNELFDGPDSDEAPRRGEPGVPDDTDTVAQTDLLIAVLKAIRPEDRAEFMAAMETGKLRTELREQLQIRLAALYGRVYSRRTTSKIVA